MSSGGELEEAVREREGGERVGGGGLGAGGRARRKASRRVYFGSWNTEGQEKQVEEGRSRMIGKMEQPGNGERSEQPCNGKRQDLCWQPWRGGLPGGGSSATRRVTGKGRLDRVISVTDKQSSWPLGEELFAEYLSALKTSSWYDSTSLHHSTVPPCLAWPMLDAHANILSLHRHTSTHTPHR